MSNLHSPDLLTTHQYIVEATEVLGETTFHALQHRFTTKVMEPTTQVPVPHVLEAKVSVPIKAEHPETGALSFLGPRVLSIELSTDDMPRSDKFVSGRSSKFICGSETEQRVLAKTSFRFNTKRPLNIDGYVYYDGEKLGITEQAITDGTNKNFLLRYLAELVEKRSLGIAGAAELVTDISLHYATSLQRFESKIRINDIAKRIEQATGRAVPASLLHPPLISHARNQQISSRAGAPIAMHNTFTVDEYGFCKNSPGRRITDWIMTHYSSFTPADPGHLALYALDTITGEPTKYSFGIDVHQQVFTDSIDDNIDRFAESAAEAREMVVPFINAVSSLRRYHTAASKSLAL